MERKYKKEEIIHISWNWYNSVKQLYKNNNNNNNNHLWKKPTIIWWWDLQTLTIKLSLEFIDNIKFPRAGCQYVCPDVNSHTKCISSVSPRSRQPDGMRHVKIYQGKRLWRIERKLNKLQTTVHICPMKENEEEGVWVGKLSHDSTVLGKFCPG